MLREDIDPLKSSYPFLCGFLRNLPEASLEGIEVHATDGAASPAKNRLREIHRKLAIRHSTSLIVVKEQAWKELLALPVIHQDPRVSGFYMSSAGAVVVNETMFKNFLKKDLFATYSHLT